MKDLDYIYVTARDLPAQDRSAYLNQSCQDDPALRVRIEQMLAVADHAEAFVADPPDDEPFAHLPGITSAITANPAMAAPPRDIVGQTIGRYRITERIGEGGFGEVYQAEQLQPVRRQVAFKIIKLGMDTKQVVARFEAERQALAMMDHPNIAKVHDAGTTDTGSALSRGRPYFVMEWVRGVRITEYCDQARLTTRERIQVVIQVCQAIQHVHQKGIIHRDIKPSNILVTDQDGVPLPKVIDFGIAKAMLGPLTDATLVTQLHQFIGTPAYMSPEQADMCPDGSADIDTRSDIYSLGVLLYELLTGHTPFDSQELMSSGFDAMRRTIRDKDPPRPSTRLFALKGDDRTTTSLRRSVEFQHLVHLLKGDLDWIVMKCLEKDRQRRYDTAQELAADLQRHLDNEPVLARPPSALYKFRKAWQRNKLTYSAGMAVALALFAGTVVSTWQAVEATKARRAEYDQRTAAQSAQTNAVQQQRKAEAETQRAEAALTRSEWLVYAGNLRLAQYDFEAANGGLALHYLSECQPELRGWEYHHLSSRFDALATFRAHDRAVSSIAFSPDQRRFATGSEDGTARIWDAASGREIRVLNCTRDFVLSVAFAPDGQRLATAGGPWGDGQMTGVLKVWDAETGHLQLELAGHEYCVWSVAFSPDDRFIASSAGGWAYGPGEVILWDAQTGERIRHMVGHTHSVKAVAFSPDSRALVTGSWDGSAKVWNTADGTLLHHLSANNGELWGVAFSPDGRRIASCGVGATTVWDAVTGAKLLTLEEHQHTVRGVAFSPDSQRIATGTLDQTIRVWDAQTGREQLVLKGHAGIVRSVAFTPDGRHILSGSEDRTAKLWDAVAGQAPPTLIGHTEYVNDIAFSPDSQTLVTASGDGTAKLWEARTGRPLGSFGTWAKIATVGGLRSAAFSPDGHHLATAGDDATAKVWDLATGRLRLSLPHTNVVSSILYSPDGHRLITAVGVWDVGHPTPSDAAVWDAATGRQLHTMPHPRVVLGVGISLDGRLIATACADGLARLWDASNGRHITTLEGHTGPLQEVAFSHVGRWIATASEDKTCKVWDVRTFRHLMTLAGHTAPVRCVTFSPDDSRIVTGSDDRSAKVWETTTGMEVLSLRDQPSQVFSVAFSPDGQRLATGIAGRNGTARLWSAAQAQPER